MTTKEKYAKSDDVLARVWGMIKIDVWLAECRPFADARAIFYRESGRGILIVLFAPRFDGNDTAIYPQDKNGNVFAPMIYIEHVIGLAGARP